MADRPSGIRALIGDKEMMADFRNRFSLAPVLTGGAILWVVMFLRASPPVSPQTAVPDTPNPEEAATRQIRSALAVIEVSPISPAEKDAAAHRLLPQLSPEDQRRLAFGFFGGLSEKALYGRVIDQNGQPVAGAEVWIEGTGKFLSSGGGRGYVLTDEGGNFAATVQAYKVVITQVYHPAITDTWFKRVSRMPDWSEIRSSVQTFAGARSASYPSELLWKDYSKEKPYLLRVWRQERFERVEQSKWGGGIHLQPHGELGMLAYRKRDLVEVKEKEKGEFKAQCYWARISKPQEEANWRFVLEIQGGGLIEAAEDDILLNEAPPGPYPDRIEIAKNAGNPGFTHGVQDRRYYFELGNGKQYGSFFLTLELSDTKDDQYCSLRFQDFKINLEGGRSLATPYSGFRKYH